MAIAPPSHTRSSNTSDSWVTPEWLINKLGPFDLDPCACDTMPWPTASRMFTERDDGLLSAWSGFVWCNPPYGRALGDWLNRMSLHDNGIALVFARTDTRAFFEYVWPYASSALFIKGRLTFFRPDGTMSAKGHNSGGPSMLIGYGSKAYNRLAAASNLGKFIEVNK